MKNCTIYLHGITAHMTSLTLKQKVSFKLKKQIQGNGFNYTLALNQVAFRFLQKANKMIKDISIE